MRTAPPALLDHAPAGATEILDVILDGIASARSLIYIEHQYLSSRPVVAALTAALERHSDLELIIVLNQNPDITAYRRWQNVRLAEAGLLTHPRVGVFALWSAAGGERGTLLNQVFVHSKVLTIDDRWASVGSANLDGVSLHSYGDDFTQDDLAAAYFATSGISTSTSSSIRAVSGSRARVSRIFGRVCGPNTWECPRQHS